MLWIGLCLLLLAIMLGLSWVANVFAVNWAVNCLEIDEIELRQKLATDDREGGRALLARKFREKLGLTVWRLSVNLAKLRRN